MEHQGGWPFVGREHELRTIEAALRSGAAGVLLAGEPGTGKTRLVREVLARWSAAGGDCEWMVATPACAAVPFGAVAHLIPAGPGSGGGEHAHPRAQPSSAGRRPVVLGVDDAHLLDDQSAALVRRLAAGGRVVPVASALHGALASTVVGEVRRLAVRPLPPEAVDQILRHALPGHLDPVSRRRLHRLAGGNPLLLRELLADAVESGALARREGVWCWRGPVPAAGRLAELVRARLAAMSPAARSALELVACAETGPVSLFAKVTDASAIGEVGRSGVVVTDSAGRLRFAQPLYAEVLRANLPASRALRISALLAQARAGEPVRRRDDALLTAALQLHSGDVRNPKLLLLAAREASARLDLDLAERLARVARTAGTSWEADSLLARILQSRGRYDEAAQVLPGPPDSRGERLATWAVTRARLLYWGAGQPDQALRALDELTPDEPGGDLTESSRAGMLLLDGRCRHALRTAAAVLGRPASGDEAVASARLAATAAAGLLGRLGHVLEVRQSGPAAGYGACLALRLAGHLAEAAALAEDGYRAAVTGDGYRAALADEAGPGAGGWAALRGIVLKARGYAAEAQDALREALVLFGEHDTYRLGRVCLAELAGAYALAGNTGRARDCLARADRLSQALAGADSDKLHRPGRVNRLFDAWVELNRAWVRVAEGELSTSVDLALRAAKLAQESDQPAYELICRYDAIRIGGPAAAAGESLRQAAIVVEGRVAPVLVTVAECLAVGDGAGLERAAAALAGEGQALLAAEVATAAARAFEQAGQRVHMRRLLQRAAALADPCHGVRTPLLDIAGRVGVLSRREREVAALATSRSSRQIAQRLVLSVNTVNNTLARVFAKLDVGNRAELAAHFGTGPTAGREAGVPPTDS